MAAIEHKRELLYGLLRAVCYAKAHEEVPTELLEEIESASKVPVARPQQILRELRCTNRGLWASWALFERQYIIEQGGWLAPPCNNCASATWCKCPACVSCPLCTQCPTEMLPCLVCVKIVHLGFANKAVFTRFMATHPRSPTYVHRTARQEEPAAESQPRGSASSSVSSLWRPQCP